MENKITKREVFADINLEYKEHPIEELTNILIYLKSFEATHFDLYVDKSYDGDEVYGVDFTPVKRTFETDEERILREEKETTEKLRLQFEAEQRKEAYEREQLRRLKEKYEQ